MPRSPWGSGGWRAVLLGLLFGALLAIGDHVPVVGGPVLGLAASVVAATSMVAYWTGLRRYVALAMVAASLAVVVLALDLGAAGESRARMVDA